MAHKAFDLAQQLTTGTGTGALSLGAVPAGMLGFASQGATTGDTFWGCIRHTTANEVEVTLCTFVGDGTITRASVPLSSTTGAKINFSAGTKTISCVAPASKLGPVQNGSGQYDFSGAIGIPNGLAAAPGMFFGSNPDIGFYKATGAGDGFGQSIDGTAVSQLYFRPASTFDFDNVWLRLGTGADIEDTGGDTYVSTIGPPSAAIVASGAHPVGINIGSWNVTYGVSGTVTGSVLMGELDKVDILAGAGAVTVPEALGWRVRSPVPHADVTVLKSSALTFTRPTAAGATGTTEDFAFVLFPTAVGSATTVHGLRFVEAYNGGAIFSDAGIDLDVLSGGAIKLKAGSGGTGFLRLPSAGGTPVLQSGGAASDVGMIYRTKGASSHSFTTNSDTNNEQFRIAHVASAVNAVQVSGGAATGPVIVRAVGSDTDIDLWMRTKGTGVIRFGTRTAIGAETITGYITIKDDAGTTRKLAVVS